MHQRSDKGWLSWRTPGEHWRECHQRIVAPAGDVQQPAHSGGRIAYLAIAYEPELFDGIVFVSRANQAAAFEGDLPLEFESVTLAP
jgi:hypothetical protein